MGGLKHQSYRDMGSWQNIYLGKSFSKTAILKGVTNFFFWLHVNFRAGGRSLKASCLVGMVLDWSPPDHSPQPTIQQRVLCLLLASYVLSLLETLQFWIKIVEVCLSSIAYIHYCWLNPNIDHQIPVFSKSPVCGWNSNGCHTSQPWVPCKNTIKHPGPAWRPGRRCGGRDHGGSTPIHQFGI